MQTSFDPPPSEESKPTLSPVTLAIAAVAVLVVAAAVYFLFAPVPGPKSPTVPATVNLRMNAAEQEYLSKISVSNIALSRAENFLHQEVTIVNGDVANNGNEPVSGLRLTIEFADDMNQVALRETRPVLGTPESPLAPGQRRAFEISVEHVPASWNMQQPAVHATYLQLPSHK
jgi:hypothetical protein